MLTDAITSPEDRSLKHAATVVDPTSSETPNIESYMFARENLGKYNVKINIVSKALKKNVIEVNTTLSFEDREGNNKKAHFEIIYASIIKLDDAVKEKKEIEKIILCDVQNKIYPNLEKAFLNLIKISGYPEIKIEKKIDFEKLYNQRNN